MSQPDLRYLGRPYSIYSATILDCYTTTAAQTHQRWTTAVCSDTTGGSGSQMPPSLSLT